MAEARDTYLGFARDTYVRYDYGMEMAEIVDDLGSNYQYWRDNRGRYLAKVAPGVIFPTEDVKIWRDHEKRVFLVYTPLPKFKKVFQGERSLEGVPRTAEELADRCRIIGIIKTEKRDGRKMHTVHPHCQDREVLEAYARHAIFYFNLDGTFVPVFDELKKAQG